MTRVRTHGEKGECPLCGAAWGNCSHADPAEFGLYELPLCPCAAEMEGLALHSPGLASRR